MDHLHGGIVGEGLDLSLEIELCYNLGTINSSICAGGIMGHTNCTLKIASSYNTGTINSTSLAGGILGDAAEITTVYNCYNAGTIDGTCIGGIFGSGSVYSGGAPEIHNSYSTSYDLVGNTDLSQAGTNTEITIDTSEGKVEVSDMKSSDMIDLLNNAITTDYEYVQDTNNINNGYPILSWQQ